MGRSVCYVKPNLSESLKCLSLFHFSLSCITRPEIFRAAAGQNSSLQGATVSRVVCRQAKIGIAIVESPVWLLGSVTWCLLATESRKTRFEAYFWNGQALWFYINVFMYAFLEIWCPDHWWSSDPSSFVIILHWDSIRFHSWARPLLTCETRGSLVLSSGSRRPRLAPSSRWMRRLEDLLRWRSSYRQYVVLIFLCFLFVCYIILLISRWWWLLWGL